MVEDILKLYLGTKTLIKVENQQHWDLIIPYLRTLSNFKIKSEDYLKNNMLNLYNKYYESMLDKNFYISNKNNIYKGYKVISSDIICGERTIIHELW